MSLLRQLVAVSTGRREGIDPENQNGGSKDPPEQCKKCDSSDSVDLSSGFVDTNGIWPNLTICMIVFALALAVFILLKKHMFKKSPDQEGATPIVNSGTTSSNTTTKKPIGEVIYGERGTTPVSDEEYQRQNWYSWLRSVLSESDYELLSNGGLAALEYVRFQRLVLAFTVMVCVMSVLVILPISLSGDLFIDNMGRMTIANLEPTSMKLWIPVLFSLILFPMGIVAMKSFGWKVSSGSSSSKNRTVMFSGLPSCRANEEYIRDHFNDAYPGYGVEEVAFTYDISRLKRLCDELQRTEQALKYYAAHPVTDDNSGSEDKVRLESGWCCSCCCGDKVDAEKFYELRKSELGQEIEQECRKWKKINPVFFVTFATNAQAQQVGSDYDTCKICCSKRPETDYSKELQANRWNAYPAPTPSNVNWANLSTSGFWWYLRAILINFLLLGIVAALVALVVYLSFSGLPGLERSNAEYPGISKISPALVLFLLQTFIPELICKAVKLMKYWSRPKELIAEMRLIFADLILAILFLPSIGALSAAAVYFIQLGEASTHPHAEVHEDRKCITLPDNGALYIHYLIYFAFLSTALSLFRINLVMRYFYKLFTAKSDAEKDMAGQVEKPFAFGEEYPKFLTAFSVTVVFAFIIPLISLFGVIALMMKYFMDQYLLCNVYKRSIVPNDVHTVAVNQFFSGILLQLFFMTLFFVLRDGLDAFVVVLIMTLVTFSAIFITMSFCGVCRKVSMFDMSNGEGDSPDGIMETGPVSYGPPVLCPQQTRRQVQENTDE